MNEAGAAMVHGPLERWWPLVFGLGAGLLLWFATARLGLGLLPDSAAFLSGAESVRAGEGFLLHTGEPMAAYPPGYSTVLAGCGWLGLPLPLAARVLHAAVFGALVVAAGWLVRQLVEVRSGAVLGSLLVLTSAPLFDIAAVLASDLLFALLAAVFMLTLDQYLADRRVPWFLALTALGAAGCLLRYVGVTLVCAAVVAFAMSGRGVPVRRRAVEIVAHAGLGFAPLLAWFARNHALTGTMTGPFQPGTPAPLTIVGDAFRIMGGWIFPEAVPFRGVLGAAIVFLAVLRLRCVVQRHWWAGDRDMRPMLPHVLLLGYLAFLALSSTRVWVAIDDRMLAPVAVFGWIVLLQPVVRVVRRIATPSRSFQMRIAAVAVLALVMLGGVVRVGRHVRESHGTGLGLYEQRHWHSSPLISLVAALPPDRPLYSNVPDAIYLFTGRRTPFSPKRYPPKTADDLRATLPAGAYLAWSHQLLRVYLVYQIPEIADVVSLTPVHEVPDGVVYRVD